MFIPFIKINILYSVCHSINLEYKFIEKTIFTKFIKEKSLLVIKPFVVKKIYEYMHTLVFYIFFEVLNF